MKKQPKAKGPNNQANEDIESIEDIVFDYDRWRIHILLRINASLNSELGIDSLVKEKKYVKSLIKENLTRIKGIDPEFFKTIDDKEGN